MWKQRGAALLSALLITALAAALAAEVAANEGWLLTQAGWSRGAERSSQALTYAKQKAMTELYMMMAKDPQHLIYRVPKAWQKLGNINGVDVVMRLEDAQTKWNINSISQSDQTYNNNSENTFGANLASNDLSRLLQTISRKVTVPGMSQPTALSPALAWQLVTLIKNYIGPYRSDILDRYYIRQHPPYFPSHQMMMHISQMRAIRGVTRLRYLQWQGYLTALPTTLNQINVNDLSPKNPLLAVTFGVPAMQLPGWGTCLQGLSLIKTGVALKTALQANCPQLIQNNPGSTSSDDGSILSRVAVDNNDNGSSSGKTQLTTHTNYIFVTIQAKIGQQTLWLRALLFADKTVDNRLIVRELWETTNPSDS